MKTAKKSLPKLSDSETRQEFSDRLNALYPELPKTATYAQQQDRMEAMVKCWLESPFLPDEEKEDLRNQTWQNNHGELTRAIGKLTGQNGRMPTVNQLAVESGMSRQTICKHLKEFHHSTQYQDQINQFRLLGDRVLANLYNIAMQGDVRAAKVFLDALGGLPQADKQPAENTNYIQVNNNVKIDQITFTTLPGEVQQQIAELFLKGLLATRPGNEL